MHSVRQHRFVQEDRLYIQTAFANVRKLCSVPIVWSLNFAVKIVVEYQGGESNPHSVATGGF